MQGVHCNCALATGDHGQWVSLSPMCSQLLADRGTAPLPPPIVLRIRPSVVMGERGIACTKAQSWGVERLMNEGYRTCTALTASLRAWASPEAFESM